MRMPNPTCRFLYFGSGTSSAADAEKADFMPDTSAPWLWSEKSSLRRDPLSVAGPSEQYNTAPEFCYKEV